MNVDPSLMIETIRRIINGFFAILPKIALAIIVFLIFFFLARQQRAHSQGHRAQ